MTEQTPRERLEARGYTFDEKGNTVEKGYSGDPFDEDARGYAATHKPSMKIICSASNGKPCGQTLAEVWAHPGGGEPRIRSWMWKAPAKTEDERAAFVDHLMRNAGDGQMDESWAMTLMGHFDSRPRYELESNLDHYTSPDGGYLLVCEKHGPVRVHNTLIRAELAAGRRRLVVDTRDGRVGYASA